MMEVSMWWLKKAPTPDGKPGARLPLPSCFCDVLTFYFCRKAMGHVSCGRICPDFSVAIFVVQVEVSNNDPAWIPIMCYHRDQPPGLLDCLACMDEAKLEMAKCLKEVRISWGHGDVSDVYRFFLHQPIDLIHAWPFSWLSGASCVEVAGPFLLHQFQPRSRWAFGRWALEVSSLDSLGLGACFGSVGTHRR